MNLLSYIAYFENIAAALVDINHSQEDCHFVAMAPEQVPNATLDNLSSPVFILEDYDIIPWLKNGDSISKRIQGAFSIVMHVNNSGIKDEIAAVSFAENIIEQVWAKLLHENEHGYLKGRYFRLDSCEASPVRHFPVDYFGMRATLLWELPYILCIQENYWQNPHQNQYVLHYAQNYFL